MSKDSALVQKIDELFSVNKKDKLPLIYKWSKEGSINENDFTLLISIIVEEDVEQERRNNGDWFNQFQEVDDFVFNSLDVDRVIVNKETPSQNTIANIKQLIQSWKPNRRTHA